MATTDLQVAGLMSGFDWKSFIDQMMAIEHKPADQLAAEQSTNAQQSSLIGSITDKLTAVQSAADALSAPGVFSARTATMATPNSGWTATAGTSATPGSYTFAVTQLATAATMTGAGALGAKLVPNGDTTAVTLANLPVAQAVTAGTFTVNGQQITVDLSNSLQDVFDQIASKTGNTVTATYDVNTDTVSLSSTAGPLMLGAATDTSNFLTTMKLALNGTGAVTSAGPLGAVKANALLKDASFAHPITNVDAAGNGTFSINNVSIGYNVNTDTLASVLTRINASAAGVTATYNASHGQLVLANKATGNVGIAVAEPAPGGGLVTAVGLASGTSFSAGRNALYSVNGGPTQTSTSNTLTDASSGVTGLSVTVTSADTQTVNVASDTAGMRTKVEAFLNAYNTLQTYIDNATKVVSSNGTVTAAALSNNREVQGWAETLRKTVFASVSSATGTVKRLNDLGIDFQGTSDQLSVVDSAKLDAALADPSSGLADFFGKATTGFSARIDAAITTASKEGGDEQQQLTDTNKSIDDQIAAIERRIAQDREQMTAAFQAMEAAQATVKQQQATLNNAFASKSS